MGSVAERFGKSAKDTTSNAAGRLTGMPSSGLGLLAPGGRLAPHSGMGRPARRDHPAFNTKVMLMWRMVALEEEEEKKEGPVVCYTTMEGFGMGANRSAAVAAMTDGRTAANSSQCWREDAAKTQKSRPEKGDWTGRDGDKSRRDDKKGDDSKGDRERKNKHVLEASATSWLLQQQLLREARKIPSEERTDVEVVREMKSILNKLTIERFDHLYTKLINCGIHSAEHIEVLMREVFEKATTQHHFISMYADLCAQLHAWFMSGKTASTIDNKTFKKILLTQCQHSFEHHTGNCHSENFKEMDPIKREEAEALRKTQSISNLKFIGALLETKLLASKILGTVTEALLMNPTPEKLECLAVFLTAVGPTFDRSDSSQYAQMASAFQRVKTHAHSKDLPARTRFLLQDVLDLRKSSWEKKKSGRNEAPTTLDQVHKKAELELGGKINATRVALPRETHIAVSHSEQKMTEPERRCAPTKEEIPSAPFDPDKFRKELSGALRELDNSLDVKQMLQRIAAQTVPSDQQGSMLAETLTCTAEQSRAQTRQAGFAATASLFITGVWRRAALVQGLETFFSTFNELKLDMPTLPQIVQEELAPALAGLITAGLLKPDTRDEFLAVTATSH